MAAESEEIEKVTQHQLAAARIVPGFSCSMCYRRAPRQGFSRAGPSLECVLPFRFEQPEKGSIDNLQEFLARRLIRALVARSDRWRTKFHISPGVAPADVWAFDLGG